MALKIRLQRHGAAHAPVYRMVVTEARHRRDGRHAENLGQYNPKARGQDKELNLKLDRIEYWLGVGAQPSDTARTLINRARREAGLVASVKHEQPAKAEAAAPAPATEATPEAPAEEAPAPAAEEAAPEAPAEPVAEAPAAEETSAAEASTEPAAEAPAEEEKRG
ncbi:MAG: 30S ribosomal protein S16 [Verrucomicrobiota bacterium]